MIIKDWKIECNRMIAFNEIENLSRAIQINNIFKEIIERYGGDVDTDIEIEVLKAEKKYKERLYKEQYGDITVKPLRD